MHVDIAQAVAHRVVGFDENQDFFVGRDGTGIESLQPFENLMAVLEVAAGQFANHEGMADYRASVEQSRQLGYAATKVLDPDGGID